MTKGDTLIHQEDIAILNLHAVNNMLPKYILKIDRMKISRKIYKCNDSGRCQHTWLECVNCVSPKPTRCFSSSGSPAGHTIDNRHMKCIGETRTSLKKKSVAALSVEQAHRRRGRDNQAHQEPQRQRHENRRIRCG